MRTTELRIERSVDPLWWGFAGLLGFACLSLPNTFQISERQTLQLLDLGSFFLCGAFLGFVRPTGVWRWGVATTLPLPALDLSRIADAAAPLAVAVPECIRLLETQAPVYGIHAVAAIAGAYAGAFWGKG